MSAVAHERVPKQGRGAGRARPRGTPGTRARRRPHFLASGVLWIVLFAALLAGVVAINVAVLQLNVELDRTGRERAELKADVARLRAELSSAAATANIERVAIEELGLTPADPDTTTYVTLPPR